MKNRNIVFTMNLLAAACLMFSPVAQARRPSEDRGNGNSAAENVDALNLSTTGSNNTAHGWFSLFSNTSGSSNTADGFQALLSNTTGTNNTATGFGALFGNTEGTENTATGTQALNQNTTGDANTAVGRSALFSNTIGGENTAVGFHALEFNTAGFFNTAIGEAALINNTTGSDNTVIGNGAGGSLTTGSGNVYIGTLVTGLPDEDNTTRIRNIIVTPIVDGLQVAISQGDKLGVAVSSRRYKEDIKPMDKTSERLFALKPVTFRAKANVDPGNVKLYGLIAEDVAAVDSDLVVYNAEGQPETLRFDSINAMLLNEFLKEHRKVEKLNDQFQTTVARQQKEIEGLTAQLKEQAAQIQKVSTQVEVSKFATGRIGRGGPAPQMVNKNQ
jgi:Chaperone of endosialidase